ncbi:hypothetical protein JWH11_12260 [Xanthomonas melonis]|uniref:Uncharacterized protein n=1 Tax=Xanthomonas melonis TaxID=56456 RepID=A0ABS8NVU6_9XANT|nr:hypothetical protein [Xanthomonas sp. NCPPB 1067]MCD0246399.1 hypothetical protein [Xanthomonas melonis]MCD0258830.1 hypothetical protein [Xanthomonas melonis]MCD0267197.1 hypothetical protein [Xanthomonas melonis]
MRPAAVRRHWHHWPWGWMALGSSLATWVCAALLAVVFTASISMPGDGSHALQSTRSAGLLVLAVAATTTLCCLIASPAALRWQRQPAAGAIALALLVSVLVLFGLTLLGLRI